MVFYDEGQAEGPSQPIGAPAMLFLVVGSRLLSGLWTLAQIHMFRTQVQAAVDAAAAAGAVPGGYIDVRFDPSGNVSSCTITLPYEDEAHDAAGATWAENAPIFAPRLSPSWTPSDIGYEKVPEGSSQGYQVTATIRYTARVFAIVPYERSLTESATAVPSPPPGLCP